MRKGQKTNLKIGIKKKKNTCPTNVIFIGPQKNPKQLKEIKNLGNANQQQTVIY